MLTHINSLLWLFRKTSDSEILCLVETCYNALMTSLNRGIPVTIAVYRYLCVFHDTMMNDRHKKVALQNLILWFLILSAGFNGFVTLRFPSSFRSTVLLTLFYYTNVEIIINRYLIFFSGLKHLHPVMILILMLTFPSGRKSAMTVVRQFQKHWADFVSALEKLNFTNTILKTSTRRNLLVPWQI